MCTDVFSNRANTSIKLGSTHDHVAHIEQLDCWTATHPHHYEICRKQNKHLSRQGGVTEEGRPRNLFKQTNKQNKNKYHSSQRGWVRDNRNEREGETTKQKTTQKAFQPRRGGGPNPYDRPRKKKQKTR